MAAVRTEYSLSSTFSSSSGVCRLVQALQLSGREETKEIETWFMRLPVYSRKIFSPLANIVVRSSKWISRTCLSLRCLFKCAQTPDRFSSPFHLLYCIRILFHSRIIPRHTRIQSIRHRERKKSILFAGNDNEM